MIILRFITLAPVYNIKGMAKKIFNTILFLLFVLSQAIAQCNEYFQFEQGTEWEMYHYNDKDKLTGKMQQKVTALDRTATGFNAKVHSVSYNAKNKEQAQTDIIYSCENGTLFIDMRNFIAEEQLKPFENFEMKVDAKNLEIPKKLEVGQSLNDANATITALNAPFPLKLSVDITNRKVAGKESITTPAGTFECFKITSNSTFKSIVTAQFSTTDWLAPRVGIVKSEVYNKNGKLLSYSILSSRK